MLLHPPLATSTGLALGSLAAVVWLLPLLVLAGLVSGLRRGSDSGSGRVSRFVPGLLLLAPLSWGLSAYSAKPLQRQPNRIRMSLAALCLLLGGPGFASLLGALIDGQAAVVTVGVLTVVPLLALRRLWARTAGVDGALDQALQDAKQSPANGWVPEGRVLVPAAFALSAAVLLLLASKGVPLGQE